MIFSRPNCTNKQQGSQTLLPFFQNERERETETESEREREKQLASEVNRESERKDRLLILAYKTVQNGYFCTKIHSHTLLASGI